MSCWAGRWRETTSIIEALTRDKERGLLLEFCFPRRDWTIYLERTPGRWMPATLLSNAPSIVTAEQDFHGYWVASCSRKPSCQTNWPQHVHLQKRRSVSERVEMMRTSAVVRSTSWCFMSCKMKLLVTRRSVFSSSKGFSMGGGAVWIVKKTTKLNRNKEIWKWRFFSSEDAEQLTMNSSCLTFLPFIEHVRIDVLMSSPGMPLNGCPRFSINTLFWAFIETRKQRNSTRNVDNF